MLYKVIPAGQAGAAVSRRGVMLFQEVTVLWGAASRSEDENTS